MHNFSRITNNLVYEIITKSYEIVKNRIQTEKATIMKFNNYRNISTLPLKQKILLGILKEEIKKQNGAVYK